jgi:hypothetical protein
VLGPLEQRVGDVLIVRVRVRYAVHSFGCSSNQRTHC